MNREHRINIRRFAERVSSALRLTVPVNVEQAVEQLGGTINRNLEGEPNMPEASVRAVMEGATKFEISISPAVGEHRYRFSVAHEIAHLFLHMGYLTDKWGRNSEYVDNVMYRYGYSKEEAEAHEFAGTLLMPEAEFRSKVDELKSDGKVPLEPLAQHFGVSAEAARMRGRYLNLFEWS